jgi:hypothetical protein
MDRLVQQELPVRKVLHQLLQALSDTQVQQVHKVLQGLKVRKETLEQRDQLELQVHKVFLDQLEHKV